MGKLSKLQPKKGIQLENYEYHEVEVSCACGNTFIASSIQPSLRVDICSKCHPFFTGSDTILDTEGRVEKFRKKYKSVLD